MAPRAQTAGVRIIVPDRFSAFYDESEKSLPVGVGGLLINAAGEVCAISRKNDQTDFGIPGGKVDQGETEAEALVRELFEELGILAKRYHRVFATLDAHGYWFVTFLVHDWDGTPHDHERKGAVVRWIPPRGLLEASSFREYNQDLFGHLGLLPRGPG